MIDNLVRLNNDYMLTKKQYYDFLKNHMCETCDNINCCGLCEFRPSEIKKEYSTLTSIFLMAKAQNQRSECHSCGTKGELQLCEYCGWSYCKSCMHEKDQCNNCYEVMK